MLVESQALKVNLEETAVDQVDYDPRYKILLDSVKEYQGVHNAASHLLFEIHHPYKNWDAIIKELRGFGLKNLKTYLGSAHPDQVLRALFDLYFFIIKEAPKPGQRQKAADALLAFLEKVASHTDSRLLGRLLPQIDYAFRKVLQQDQFIIDAIARSYHPISKVVLTLLKRLEKKLPGYFLETAGRLLVLVNETTLNYWLSQEDPLYWLERTIKSQGLDIDEEQERKVRNLFSPISHATFKIALQGLWAIPVQGLGHGEIERLARRPGHMDIVRSYRQIARDLGSVPTVSAPVSSENLDEVPSSLQLFFLFHILEIEGLAPIHEETLRQINKTLVCLVRRAELDRLSKILPKSFSLLKQQVGHFPRTALQCIEALGLEVFRRNNERLTELFLEEVVQFGFQTPGVKGVDAEWQVLCNPAHLQNIRVWLKLIEFKPKLCSTLISALMLNLRLAGTCIRDTDLFQKDVSRLLNSEIEPVYNLVKQLTKVIPVYYNEIGAEGKLREVSTELDEISNRRDILIHFLRKQSHVESNNLIVAFIEAIFCFWYSKDKSGLRSFLPPEIYEQVSVHGQYVDHVHKLVRHLAKALGLEPFSKGLRRLLDLPQERLEGLLNPVSDVPAFEKQRLLLLIEMYRLETLKYQLSPREIRRYLQDAATWGFEGLGQIVEALDRDDPEECLDLILNELERLKEIICSSKRFEIVENIYHKRHIAADIPSMYGRYHERKFDALSLTFRLENLANLYFERLVTSLDVPFITRTMLVRILKCLKLFWRAIKLNGVRSKKFYTYLTLLEKSLQVRRFSFTQYQDIVRGLSEGVKDMIYVHYISPHQDNIAVIVRQLGPDNLLPQFKRVYLKSATETEVIEKISEMLLRDLIANSFGLQYLDNFIARVWQVLGEEKEVLDERSLDLLLSFDPDQTLCSIYNPEPALKNLIHLGNKGFNLVLLVNEGLRVPPGVIVTTEVFRWYSIIQKFKPVFRDFKWRLKRQLKKLELETGRIFGSMDNPLLLSVRSGAAISMPGMMSTIINVGSNLQTTEAIARRTGNLWFAWDNYRRFIQAWGMSFGLSRDVFSQIMKSKKRRHGVEKKREFTGEQMKELAMMYRDAVLDHGIEIVDDPFEQLMVAFRLVLGSWESEKARAYREIMEISDNWGTAVIIQAMAFGNLSSSSGTGVLFTANPYRKLDRVCLWGDYTPGNQGEDIVSGLVSTYPISIEQKQEMGLEEQVSLEEAFPAIYKTLYDWAKYLVYEKKWTPQEIEFTFEGPDPEDLFILQGRDMITKERKTITVFLQTEELEAGYLGRGIGVSGGALSGRAVFNLQDIQKYRTEEPDTPLILIRSDTVPDDIKEISQADGLLTAKGGQTSHAAIVAFRLEKTSVVGCSQMQVYEAKGLATFQSRAVKSGDYISVDGWSGAVYMGSHPTQSEEQALF